MSPVTMEETLPEIIRALMPHNPTSGSIPANSCTICYELNQSVTEKCECGYPVRFHEEKRGLLAKLFSGMFRTKEPESEIMGKLAPWMENLPGTAISLPTTIMDNASFTELEETTEVLIIPTEYFEGTLINDRKCSALKTTINESLVLEEYRVLSNPNNEKRFRDECITGRGKLLVPTITHLVLLEAESGGLTLDQTFTPPRCMGLS